MTSENIEHKNDSTQESYPFHPDHPYRPQKAALSELVKFEETLGIERLCLIAVSVYGTDNSSILDALTRLNGKGRAVVSIDPVSVTEEELEHMQNAGVRGIRLNLKTYEQNCSKEQLEHQLFTYANRIRRYGWLIQLYLGLEQVALIHECVPKLKVPIVIDHMASPKPTISAKRQKGFHELLDLLQRNLIWIKISGVYRFSQLPDLNEYAKTLIRINPARVVWASDWPHTGGTAYNVNGDRHKYQPFRQVDDMGFVERCFDWCRHDQDLIKKLFVDNPQSLWMAGDNAAVFEPGAQKLMSSSIS